MLLAVKFHYQFNMRELGNIAQGLCRMTKEAYKQPLQASRVAHVVAVVCTMATQQPAITPCCFDILQVSNFTSMCR